MERNVRKPVGRQMGLVAGDDIVKGPVVIVKYPGDKKKSRRHIRLARLVNEAIQTHYWFTMPSHAKRKTGDCPTTLERSGDPSGNSFIPHGQTLES